MLPELLNSIAFWKVSRLRLFVLLVRATCRWRWVQCIGGTITFRGKHKCWETNLSQCPSEHYKSHMDGPGIETGPQRWQAGD
jgi:hypothetical protein